MKILQIQAFVEIAHSNSISHAAENLYLSQSTLSSLIASFEEELQLTLFNRSKKGVTLTNDGKKILDEAELILRITKRWELLHLNNSISGNIHIFAPPSICSTTLLDVTSQAKFEYPDLNIFLHEPQENFEIHTLLTNPKYQIYLTWFLSEAEKNNAISLARSKGYDANLLFQEQYFLIMHKDCPIATKDPIYVTDLQGLLFTILHNVAIPFDNIKLPLSLLNQFSSNKCIFFSNITSVLSFIAKNPNAVTILSSEIVKFPLLNDGPYVKKTIADLPMPAWCVIFYSAAAHISAAEKYVVDLIKSLV